MNMHMKYIVVKLVGHHDVPDESKIIYTQDKEKYNICIKFNHPIKQLIPIFIHNNTQGLTHVIKR